MAEPVYIISVGSFGKGVARYLKLLNIDVVEMSVDGSTIEIDELKGRAVILAAWRPVPKLCSHLNEQCHKQRCPFIPLFVASRMLHLGPIIVPGNGGCWDCWVQREKQHDRDLDHHAILLDYYEANPYSGPKGYLEPFAMMGAARISQVINSLDLNERVGGDLWQIDMVTRQIKTSTLIGVHNCPHCGLRRPADTRSFAEMRDALSYMW